MKPHPSADENSFCGSIVGLRAKQGDIQAAEYAAAVHWAVTLRASLDETLGIGQDCKGVADYRPAIVTRDMRQRFAGWASPIICQFALRTEN
jgi:hypothetical protein